MGFWVAGDLYGAMITFWDELMGNLPVWLVHRQDFITWYYVASNGMRHRSLFVPC